MWIKLRNILRTCCAIKTFRYLSNSVTEAPKFFCRSNLMWWKKYGTTAILFVPHAHPMYFLYILKQQRSRKYWQSRVKILTVVGQNKSNFLWTGRFASIAQLSRYDLEVWRSIVISTHLVRRIVSSNYASISVIFLLHTQKLSGIPLGLRNVL